MSGRHARLGEMRIGLVVLCWLDHVRYEHGRVQNQPTIERSTASAGQAHHTHNIQYTHPYAFIEFDMSFIRIQSGFNRFGGKDYFFFVRDLVYVFDALRMLDEIVFDMKSALIINYNTVKNI